MGPVPCSPWERKRKKGLKVREKGDQFDREKANHLLTVYVGFNIKNSACEK